MEIVPCLSGEIFSFDKQFATIQFTINVIHPKFYRFLLGIFLNIVVILRQAMFLLRVCATQTTTSKF